MLVRIQGREVIVLLREAKRPSSIRSEKVELRVKVARSRELSSPTDAPLPGRCDRSSQPYRLCAAGAHPLFAADLCPTGWQRGIMLQGTVMLISLD